MCINIFYRRKRNILFGKLVVCDVEQSTITRSLLVRVLRVLLAQQ